MTKRIKIIILKIIILLVIMFLFFIIVKMVIEPININEDEIEEVYIGCMEGRAHIINDEEIKDVVRVVNSIKAIKGDDTLVEYIGGDSPDASVNFYDGQKDDKHYIYFYGNLILYDDNYYKIIGLSTVQYNKVKKLCEKYAWTYE